MCLRQDINIAPIEWPIGSSSPPVTVVGDPTWTDVKASVDVLLEQSGSADLIGHSNGVEQFGPGSSPGYHLRVNSSGSWSLFAEDSDGNDRTLASGSRSIGTNMWHTLSLNLNGTSIQASIDGTTVADVTDSAFRGGQVGLLVRPAVHWAVIREHGDEAGSSGVVSPPACAGFAVPSFPPASR